MYCYNFGIHDLEKDPGYFYVCDETLASRGSQEVASCIIKHLKEQATNKSRITIYSDSCIGQNRNIKMSLALLKFLLSSETSIKTIDQKCLVSGRSVLPNDQDFGSVELAAKNKTIYLPEQWYKIMTTCRRNKNFLVSEMNCEFFYQTPRKRYC